MCRLQAKDLSINRQDISTPFSFRIRCKGYPNALKGLLCGKTGGEEEHLVTTLSPWESHTRGRDRAPGMGGPRRRLFLSALMILLAAWTSSAGAIDDSASVECTLEQGNGGTQHTDAPHVRRTAGNFKGLAGPRHALAQPLAFALVRVKCLLITNVKENIH